MTDSKAKSASWETADWRVVEKPADWYGTATCLIDGCTWDTACRGPYEVMHRDLRRRMDAHQQSAHLDGSPDG